MDKKYELIKTNVEGLYRIKALIDFGLVKAGDIGGCVKSESNLSHEGDCWIYDNDVSVQCGCFNGTIEKFKSAVEKTYDIDKDCSYYRQYMGAIQYSELIK